MAQRNERAYEGIRVFLEAYVAKAVNPTNPEQVRMYSAYWGPLGVNFAWEGLSRPRTALTGQGPVDGAEAAASAVVLNRLVPEAAKPATTAARRPSALAGGAHEDEAATLDGISPARRRDIFVNAFLAEDIAHRVDLEGIGLGTSAPYSLLDPDTAKMIVALDAAATGVGEDSIDAVLDSAERSLLKAAAQGAGGRHIFGDLGLRISEAISRTEDSGLFVASRLLEELRRPLNDMITLFIGDVFAYLANRVAADAGVESKGHVEDAATGRRSSPPGSIPREVLRVILRAVAERQDPDEPLVVLSHSMGGQIVYDLVSYFLPSLMSADANKYGTARIDFWAAAASQVGLFEEMKMFLASQKEYSGSSSRVPMPDPHTLGVWWNVWDRNDYISYTADAIFDGVLDEEFVSGRSLLAAHGGYLTRPSFFRKFAGKINEARATNFRRPSTTL